MPAPAHPKHSRMSGIMRHSPHGGSSTPTMVRQSSSSELDAALCRIRGGGAILLACGNDCAARVRRSTTMTNSMFDAPVSTVGPATSVHTLQSAAPVPSSGRVTNSKRPVVLKRDGPSGRRLRVHVRGSQGESLPYMSNQVLDYTTAHDRHLYYRIRPGAHHDGAPNQALGRSPSTKEFPYPGAIDESGTCPSCPCSAPHQHASQQPLITRRPLLTW
ncbi:hypothetical protein LZ31DRAFT_81754 [Colletotrichum somersetense]|nr:hypothetical protein LZ31DRAFT_81754 [Colletotrichum somersetense]